MEIGTIIILAFIIILILKFTGILRPYTTTDNSVDNHTAITFRPTEILKLYISEDDDADNYRAGLSNTLSPDYDRETTRHRDD